MTKIYVNNYGCCNCDAVVVKATNETMRDHGWSELISVKGEVSTTEFLCPECKIENEKDCE